MAAQLDEVVRLTQATLAPSLQGAYLYGSAVMGGLKPASDLDVFVVTGQWTSREERRSLTVGCGRCPPERCGHPIGARLN